MLDDQNGKQKVMYDLLAPRSRHAQTAAFFSHPTVWVENKQASKLFTRRRNGKPLLVVRDSVEVPGVPLNPQRV